MTLFENVVLLLFVRGAGAIADDVDFLELAALPSRDLEVEEI